MGKGTNEPWYPVVIISFGGDDMLTVLNPTGDTPNRVMLWRCTTRFTPYAFDPTHPPGSLTVRHSVRMKSRLSDAASAGHVASRYHALFSASYSSWVGHISAPS